MKKWNWKGLMAVVFIGAVVSGVKTAVTNAYQKAKAIENNHPEPLEIIDAEFEEVE